jgi:hypothetical protein
MRLNRVGILSQLAWYATPQRLDRGMDGFVRWALSRGYVERVGPMGDVLITATGREALRTAWAEYQRHGHPGKPMGVLRVLASPLVVG